MTTSALVFDADSHVLEPPTLWEDYLPSELKSRAIRFRLDERGTEQLWADDKVLLPNRLAALGGVNLERQRAFDPRSGLTYLDGAPAPSMDGAARIALFEEWGTTAGLILPTVGILWDSADNALANAYCRAYNDWVYDFQAPDRRRLLVAAHLNLYDIDAAVAELEHRLEQGFQGVFLPPERVGGKGFAHAYFDPLWARVEEAGVPILPHVIVRQGRVVTGFAGDWYERKDTNQTFTFAMGGTSQLMPAVAAMVVDGLFDKFPRLKALVIEAGCGWVAYAMDRLDEKYQHFSWQASLALERPSDYFRRNLWFCAEPEERTIGAMLELVGEDRILWGSDYPHIDSHIDAPQQIRQSLAALSIERQRRVLGENARQLFEFGPTD